MVTNPLSECEIFMKLMSIKRQMNLLDLLAKHHKTEEVTNRINLLKKQKEKYLSDLRYFSDPEYRAQETIYLEQCTTTTLDNQEEE